MRKYIPLILFLISFLTAKSQVITDSVLVENHYRTFHFNKPSQATKNYNLIFVLHLITNQHGQIIRFLITPANVADNNKQVLGYLLADLKGKCYGDKGYLSSLLEQLLQRGLHLVTKLRKNMGNMFLSLSDKINLMKRGWIEAVNDILMSVCDIDHSRHRNPVNALVQMLSGVTAYSFLNSFNSKYKPARVNT